MVPVPAAPVPHVAAELGLVASGRAGRTLVGAARCPAASGKGTIARVLTALWSVYADQGLNDKALAVASAHGQAAPKTRLAAVAKSISSGNGTNWLTGAITCSA